MEKIKNISWEEKFDKYKNFIVLVGKNKTPMFFHEVYSGFWTEIMSDIKSLLTSQREELLKEVDNKTIKLLKEFSNTPLNKRGNGWDWLIKIKNELQKYE